MCFLSVCCRLMFSVFWICVVCGCVDCSCCVSKVVCSGGCSVWVIIGLICVLFIFLCDYMLRLVMCVRILLCVVCVVLGWWFGCSWLGDCGNIVSSVVLVCDSVEVGLFR